jgi:hypothetical protein
MPSNLSLIPQRYRISSAFNRIIFPLTYPEIVESLKKRKYGMPSLSAPTQTGSRVYLEGVIAFKNNCHIHLDSNRRLLAAEGNSARNVLTVFKELMDVVENDFNLSSEDLHFSELIAELIVRSDESPINTIGMFANDVFGEFSDIMGAETSTYSIRIVPKGQRPFDKNWFDIRIDPRPTMPDRDYYINAVYRAEDVDRITAFVQDFDSKIISLIRKIEGM